MAKKTLGKFIGKVIETAYDSVDMIHGSVGIANNTIKVGAKAHAIWEERLLSELADDKEAMLAKLARRKAKREAITAPSEEQTS